MKIYVGKLYSGVREVFRCDIVPDDHTPHVDGGMFGEHYRIVEGPFHTVGGARMFASIWNGGGQCTQDGAEATAKLERDARRKVQHTSLAGLPRGF